MPGEVSKRVRLDTYVYDILGVLGRGSGPWCMLKMRDSRDRYRRQDREESE
jgi:hypothetical protein